MSRKTAGICAVSLLIVATLAWADQAEDRAISLVKYLGGKVERERSQKQPVVTVILNGTKVTDADLMDLAALRQLQSLELNDTQITDTGLANVADLTNLRELALRSTQITDTGLSSVAVLKQL